jgi:hypothetical protein
MPSASFYEGLDLASAIEALAEHHHESRTRHISCREYELLLKAVSELRSGGVGSQT